MCTVTAVPRRGGFRLCCNRDEQTTRAPALWPRWHAVAPRMAVFPVDPASGGTWIGVNDAGVAIAVLNRNDATVSRALGRRSRGLLVPSLLCHESVDQVLEAVKAVDVAAYDPFYLCAIERAVIGVVSSDCRRTSVVRHRFVRPMLLTSSGLGDALVAGPRSQLFEAMVLARRRSWLRGQSSFHVHCWPDRPHLSVMMRRNGACTVSRSTVDVSPRGIRFDYEPLSAPLSPSP